MGGRWCQTTQSRNSGACASPATTCQRVPFTVLRAAHLRFRRVNPKAAIPPRGSGTARRARLQAPRQSADLTRQGIGPRFPPCPSSRLPSTRRCSPGWHRTARRSLPSPGGGLHGETVLAPPGPLTGRRTLSADTGATRTGWPSLRWPSEHCGSSGSGQSSRCCSDTSRCIRSGAATVSASDRPALVPPSSAFCSATWAWLCLRSQSSPGSRTDYVPGVRKVAASYELGETHGRLRCTACGFDHHLPENLQSLDSSTGAATTDGRGHSASTAARIAATSCGDGDDMFDNADSSLRTGEVTAGRCRACVLAAPRAWSAAVQGTGRAPCACRRDR